MVLEAIRKQFKSNKKAAEKLHAQWMRAERPAAKRVTVNSLATQLGYLASGKTDWWGRRIVLTRLLADMLGCTDLDLLGRPVVPPGSLHFPEFPALPPLRPDEPPFRFQRDGWLLDRVRDSTHQGVRTLVAGPGMGKSFVVRWLQARAEPEFAAISTPTLAGATHLANDQRLLVIDIDERDPRTDADALRTLEQREQPTIVLAPFALPGSSPDEAPLAFDARTRNNLLAWIAQRLELGDRDTRLDPDAVREWLRANDPSLLVVTTPSDLLAFCAVVDTSGMDDATWELRARRWLRSIAPRLFAPDTSSLAPLVEPLGDELCRAMLTRREHPWGALPGFVWPTLLPNELCGPDGSRWGRAAIVHGLREAGLLRGAENGLSITPSWVRHGLAAAALDQVLAAEDINAWGLLAADESRQHLVDAALDRRTNAGFCATVRAVAHDHDRHSLGLLAAREAVFTAAARRLLRTDFKVPPADVPAWHRLAEHQIAALKPGSQTFQPLTRPGWGGIQMFWADAWAFSLRVPRPDRFDHPPLAWHFPGWISELPPLPDYNKWPSSSIQPWAASKGVRRIARLAPEVLSRLSSLPEGREFPRVLLPAVVLLAPQRGWMLTPQLLHALPGSWEGHYLATLVVQRDPAERTAIADMLWNALPFLLSANDQAPVAMRIERLQNSARAFFSFIVENLSEATLVSTIDRDGLYRHDDEVEPLRQLPRPLRRTIVRMVIAGLPGKLPSWHSARSIARLIDEEDIDLLLDIIRDSDSFVAAEFTAFVWRIAPNAAFEEALTAIAGQSPSAQPWCFHAPRDRLAELAERLRRWPRPLPGWVAQWAESRLLDAGTAAEALFELTGATSANVTADEQVVIPGPG